MPRDVGVVDGAGLKAMLVKLRGRPVIVNVFASWCGPCAAELPDLDRLAREHKQFALVGIDVDAVDADATKFLPKVPASMTVVRSPTGLLPLLPKLELPADWNEAVPQGWEQNVPITLVFNSKGAFETGSVGALSGEALAEIAKTP